MRLPHLPAGSLPVTQNFERIQALMPSGVVTKLPSAPIDEQEINYLADSANGIVWRFRYRAASTSTHKWEFIGGAALTKREPALVETNSAAYIGLGGPAITAPLAGDYEIGLSTQVNLPTKIGALASIKEDDNYCIAFTSEITGEIPITVSRTSIATGITVGQVIEMKYKVYQGGGGANARWSRRDLWLRPVRIG